MKIKEASEQCGIEIQIITTWIENEWIIPAEPKNLELDEEDLARMRLIKKLMDDFGVNEEGVSIVLHLLDQLYHLHYRLKA